MYWLFLFLKFHFVFAFNGQKLEFFHFDNIRGQSSRNKHSKRRSGEDRVACVHKLCCSCPLLNQAQWLCAHSC